MIRHPLRGGTCHLVTWYLRSTVRFWGSSLLRGRVIGFRLVLRRQV